MKKFILLLFSALIYSIVGNAQIRSMELKDGSVLYGYIEKQKATGEFTFKTQYAIREVDGASVTVSNPHKTNVKDLSEYFAEWAKKNDAIDGSGESGTIQLYRIDGKNVSSVRNAYIIEQGAKVKFFDPQTCSENHTWKDVKSVKEKKRAKTDLSGMKITYVIDGATKYEGQYAGETDSTLSLYSDNGMIHTVKVNDVKQYLFSGINPDQDIFEQSPYLDVIITKNAGTYKGIITEKNFSTDQDSEGYFILRTITSEIKMIKISDIEETGREVNPDYSPITDIVLSAGEFMLNRKEMKQVEVGNDKNGLLLIDDFALSSDSLAISVDKKFKKLTFEYIGSGENSQYKLVKLQKKTIKKKEFYAFTYQELSVNGVSSDKVVISSNNTKREEYAYPLPGVYLLYDAKMNMGIAFLMK